MPLWQIFHPPSTFKDDASKAAISKDITAIYTGIGMPAFFVVVNFFETKQQNVFVGGEPVEKRGKPFIRFVIAHIHVNVPNIDSAYARVTASIDEALEPHVDHKGYEWEYHVEETERRLWKINGLNAPPFQSEDEKVWVAENRAVPPEEMENARLKMGSRGAEALRGTMEIGKASQWRPSLKVKPRLNAAGMNTIQPTVRVDRPDRIDLTMIIQK